MERRITQIPPPAMMPWSPRPPSCQKNDNTQLDPSVADSVLSIQAQIHKAYMNVRFELGDVTTKTTKGEDDVLRTEVIAFVRVTGLIGEIGVDVQSSVATDFVMHKVASLIPEGSIPSYIVSTVYTS